MKRDYGLPFMVLALGLFGGCQRNDADRMVANGSRNGAQQQADERIGQGRMSESDLENTIRARLHDDELLKGADLNVTANADRNEVTLSGVVETRVMRDRAIELARTTHSGVAVNDRIEIRQRELSRSEYTEENASEERERARERGETIGDSLGDAWIHTMIVASLIGDRDLPQPKIRVDVKNNVVTLRGVVESAEQKIEAERVAKETEGVKRVVNQLKVERRPGKSLAVDYS
jgi:osmotically-inducible protein OsmY